MNKNNNERIKSYERKKAFYDVESVFNVFTAIFNDEHTDKTYLVCESNVPITQSDVDYLGVTLIDRSQVETIANKRQLVGFFNRSYDDYMLSEYLNGKGYSELFELSQELIHNKKPPFLWKNSPDDMFKYHTIDIAMYINKRGISLKRLASELGMDVREYDLDFDVPVHLTKEQILSLIEYNINDVMVTRAVFEHDSVQIWYKQHVAVIEKYLPGLDWAIYMTNASLSERALTQNKKYKVEMADKFVWEINGKNIFEEVAIPDQWKHAVLDYAERMEEAVAKCKEAMAKREGTPRELQREYIQKVPAPEINPINITDRFIFKPSLGGSHSYYLDENGNRAVANFKNVMHSDISGAYGTLAIPSRQFGDATEVYKMFMDDKIKTKYASIEIQETDFDSVNVKEFLSYIENKYQVDTKGITDKDDLIDQIMLERSATKLGTNDSTGKSDQPGSLLYNPIVVQQNRILLQMAMYGLCLDLANAGATLLSVNTDGVFYIGDMEKMAPIVEDWGKKWEFNVDSEMIDHYIGKDDNHRILIHNGRVIESAGELRHYSFNANYPSSVPRLVDVVITEKLMNPEKSIRELIENHKDDVELFAWTIQATKNHKTAIDYKIAQKINRVLLTTDGVTIQNYSITKDVVEKFNNLDIDNKVTIINKKIPDTLPDNIDYDAYEKLIQERYVNWK